MPEVTTEKIYREITTLTLEQKKELLTKLLSDVEVSPQNVTENEDKELELCVVNDLSEDFISKEEINYYMNLDD